MPRPTAPDPELAATIKQLREARGITQEALAHEAGITTGTLSKIELAQSSPAWVTVRAIAAALEVSLRDLGGAVESAG